MLFGYNTNGFAHHRLEDALTVLAELGYQSVAITIDHQALNPFEPGNSLNFLEPGQPGHIESTRRLLEKLGLHCVIETGARFLLDPRHKHQPTLLSPDSAGRERRVYFLSAAIEIASRVGADAVSFWSGAPTDGTVSLENMDRLVEGCKHLCDLASRFQVRLAFEPEPGMFIDTMARYAELQIRVKHPAFGLTLDIGHLHCLGETPIADHIRRWQHLLWNVHIEDMRRGIHEHLMFGEGEIDIGPVLAALREIGYSGGVHVELSRHSHDAVETARRALQYLRSIDSERNDALR
jgi:sugar phosphate isomerase/epimerase